MASSVQLHLVTLFAQAYVTAAGVYRFVPTVYVVDMEEESGLN